MRVTFGIEPVCLNSGAFATVRLAIEKDTGAKFAIKIIDKHKFETSNSSGHSLMDEVNILKKINHPNIIGIQDVFETATKMYLVLELYGFLRESERERERDVDADHVNVSCGMDALVDTHASWRCECASVVWYVASREESSLIGSYRNDASRRRRRDRSSCRCSTLPTTYTALASRIATSRYGNARVRVCHCHCSQPRESERF